MFSWIAGDIKCLLNEGQSIQKRLPKTGHLFNDLGQLARSFSKLMFQGEIHAALQLLEKGGKGGILHPDDKVDTNNPDSLSVLEVLKSKHPYAQQANTEALIQGPVPSLSHLVICDSINAASIHTAALHTKGAAGPSGLDAHCWRRLCTSYKSASHDLCHAFALVAKRLCTTLVDPSCLSAFLACRLIALDKCPGVRPIGI